jgi:energy-coupling factor transport system ATP-binding protein
MIQLTKINFKYPSGRLALSDINLQIKPGELLMIVGPNGSGKSTLGNVIAGLYRGRGEIALDNTPYKQLKPHELRRRVGIVFQNPDHQIVFANVFDDIAFALKNLKIPEAEWQPRVEESLASVGMSEFVDANPYELSYGQKQRVAIAGALALKPKYLILDEPTAMLDADARTKLYQVLAELRDAGVGLVFITNNESELKLADRVVRLQNGTIHG